jgi:hypothetical protein
MNPSSLEIDILMAQRQKDMFKCFRGMLFDDEGSPSTVGNIFSARQQVTCS